MKDINYIRFNIGFKLPRNIEQSTILLSKGIAKNKQPLFILDGENFIPHVTIYAPEFPDHNINKVFDTMKKLSIDFDPITLIYSQIESHQGYIGVEFRYTPEINNIHKKIVTDLNSLRENHVREKYTQNNSYQMNFTNEQLSNIRKYGYPDAMSLYHPHLTLIRLKDEDIALEISETLKWNFIDIKVKEIAIFRMGEHGTCTEIVETFPL